MSKEIADALDLGKTSEIFDSLIRRSDINGKASFNEEEVKKAKAVLSAGNLHVKSAQVKLGALRLVGHFENTKALKIAIERNARSARKPR